MIPSGDFEKKMMGLGLGVAAGLPAEAAQCVERGLARGALDEAVAAAAHTTRRRCRAGCAGAARVLSSEYRRAT